MSKVEVGRKALPALWALNSKKNSFRARRSCKTVRFCLSGRLCKENPMKVTSTVVGVSVLAAAFAVGVSAGVQSANADLIHNWNFISGSLADTGTAAGDKACTS